MLLVDAKQSIKDADLVEIVLDNAATAKATFLNVIKIGKKSRKHQRRSLPDIW